MTKTSSKTTLLTVAIAMCAYILMALLMGPDVGWDLKNYHYYIGYALNHGGFSQNIFPAQSQSWFNPLLDGFYVFLMEHLPPLLFTALLAFLQSLNLPLLTILIQENLQPLTVKLENIPRRFLYAAALLIGATGAMTLSELGTTFGDSLISVFLLGSLVCLSRIYGKKNDITKYVALGGASFGIAVGLKLTAAIYAPGFFLYLALSGTRPARILKNIAIFGTTAIAGLLLSDGFWLWHMWELTGNPLFPAFNGIFHSNWIGGDNNLMDYRFRAASLFAAIHFLFASAFAQHPGAEVSYYDPRFFLSFIALPFLAYQIWKKKLSGPHLGTVIFFYTGFISWIFVFGIMRYAVLLEFLSVIILAHAFLPLVTAQRRVMALVLAAILLCLITQMPEWHGRSDWEQVKSDNWFDIKVPDRLQAQDSMFLILTGEPLSYVIPSFPADATFVRMEGNLDPVPGTVLYEQRKQAIERHQGPFWTFGAINITPPQQELLAQYGLKRIPALCLPVHTNTGTPFACPLTR